MNQIFVSAQNFDLFWKPNCKVLVAKFLCKKSNSILPNSGAFPANSNQQHPKSSCCPRLGNALETPDFWVPPPLTCWKWERERERESEWRFCRRSFIIRISMISLQHHQFLYWLMLQCYKKASKNLSFCFAFGSCCPSTWQRSLLNMLYWSTMVHRPFRPKWASRAWALLHLSRSDDQNPTLQGNSSRVARLALLANLLSTLPAWLGLCHLGAVTTPHRRV